VPFVAALAALSAGKPSATKLNWSSYLGAYPEFMTHGDDFLR